MVKVLLIENQPYYHCEIIETIIVKYYEILNIEKQSSINIFLLLHHTVDPDFKKYIRNKYPNIQLKNPGTFDYYINCTVYQIDYDKIPKENSPSRKYISHEITNPLKSNPNVIFLTPLVKDKFFYADIMPFSEHKTISNIPIYIIQGNLNHGRRHLNLLNKILDKSYEEKFLITLVGRGTFPNELIKHKNKIVLKNNLNYSDFHKEFLEAYCILPLISKKKNPDYYSKKLTSTINYARGYNLKCLIDNDLQQIYELPDVEVYNDINDIANGFEKTLKEFYIKHGDK